MSSGFDDNFDWTTGENTAPAGVAYMIPDIEAANDVAVIDKEAADRDFQPPPIGDHLFEITGFWKAPEPVERRGFVRGQPVSYTAYKLGVKLAVVGHRNYSTMDFIELPPLDAAGIHAFQNVSDKPDGTNPGFMNRKFEQFVNKIGFPFPAGGKMPVEARNIDNWIGHQVYATVVPGKVNRDKVDPSTGQPYPAKNQIKLFSFRAAESTMIGTPPIQAPRPAAQVHPNSQQYGVQQPAGTATTNTVAQRPVSQASFPNKGLENI